MKWHQNISAYNYGQKLIRQKIQQLTVKTSCKISFWKVKSHTGIRGNDKADKLANISREEAKWDTEEEFGQITYNVTLCVIFQTIDLEWRKYWSSAYQRNPNYNQKRANFRLFKSFTKMRRAPATTIFVSFQSTHR